LLIPAFASLASLAALAALAGCSPRKGEREPEALSGGLYQLRGGVLVALSDAGGIQPVRRLPWTVQERVAALAVLGDRVYAGVNGRGVAELDLQGGTTPEIRYLYDPLLFAYRTLTCLIPGDTDLLVHVYFNATLNVVAAEELPLRGVSLVRLFPGSGEYRLLTPPFQAGRPAWEAVGLVAQSPQRLFFEWKLSGAEESRFAYTVLSLEPGGPEEQRADVLAYRNSFGFRDVEREGPQPLRLLVREARRRLDSREASTAYQVELRREGSPLPERYEYHPPGFARSEDIRLYTLGAVERGGRYALLLPDGVLLRAAAQPSGGTWQRALGALHLPSLPPGHRYCALLVAGEHLLATWEEPAFTEVGSAGIFLRKVPNFP
jgi:hypothetical protein